MMIGPIVQLTAIMFNYLNAYSSVSRVCSRHVPTVYFVLPLAVKCRRFNNTQPLEDLVSVSLTIPQEESLSLL